MIGYVVTSKGVVEYPIVPYGDWWVRADYPVDRGVCLEWKRSYGKIIQYVPGHSVLDIGANIGMFSRKAMMQGAERICCYEPDTASTQLLRINLQEWPDRTSIHNEAVGLLNGVVPYYISGSGNAVAATTQRSVATRQSRPVRQRAFDEVVEESGCTFIKTDCEGSELEFLRGDRLPATVKVVTGELHADFGRAELCDEVIRSFARWGQVTPPRRYSFSRYWLINYARE